MPLFDMLQPNSLSLSIQLRLTRPLAPSLHPIAAQTGTDQEKEESYGAADESYI